MITIRRLGEGDAAALVKFRKTAASESDWVNTIEEDRAESILASTANSEVEFWYGAFDGARLIGSCFIAVNKKEDFVMIGTLAVLKSHQGKGISTQFKILAETLAEKNGITKLSLYVDLANKKGFAIYKKWGFQQTKQQIVEMAMMLPKKTIVPANECAIYNRW